MLIFAIQACRLPGFIDGEKPPNGGKPLRQALGGLTISLDRQT
ncbi:MAG: hypothetical protein O7F14_08430 [Alphaproteobacteria bacterium]|nr:hypothetical protein [Alphaproteobacteria bacterium]